MSDERRKATPHFTDEDRLRLLQLMTRRAMADRRGRAREREGDDLPTDHRGDAKPPAVDLPPRWRLVPEGISLYDWQRECLPLWLSRGRGTVKVATGGGKTLFALAAAQQLQNEREPDLRLVVVVPTIPLMFQWYDEVRSVRFVDGTWKITVLYEAGAGLRYLAVEGAGADLTSRINSVKTALRDQPGGAFYVNEYRHVLVPVAGSSSSGAGSHYYYAGRLEGDLSFEFEGQSLTTKPLHPNGTPLNAGERWVGPRPGIPYVLAAGGGDIYYETPALTDEDPPAIRFSMTRRVQLSKVLGDKTLVGRAVRPIASLRGHQGGGFYVNEHGAMFTPVDAGDGNGLDYIYCGQIDRSAWFPEPVVANVRGVDEPRSES